MIKPIKVLVILAVFIVFQSSSCLDKDNERHKIIKIVNNSDKDIYYYESARFPDTTFFDASPTYAPFDYKIPAKSFKESQMRGYYEDAILANPYGKIIIFIYDANTIETTPWDTVMAKYLVLKRYDLGVEDLNRLNWIINFP